MTSKQGYGADLKKYHEKRLQVSLNAGRTVSGRLRGYDEFLNVVLEDAVEVLGTDSQKEIGTIVIRGNSITMWECLDKVH
mmetsp:Transcript_46286/g.53341  ORF Transcript_46286/g.53341 Transcript_46286/m.53341 type:complete len:80 (-) Transcript_46286:97-336(-)